MAQHGEEVVLARRLSQRAEEPGQRRVATGSAARRASLGRRAEVGLAHSASLMPMRGGQRMTVPRCGVLSVSWVKLLIAA